jgi:hypothetical protein
MGVHWQNHVIPAPGVGAPVEKVLEATIAAGAGLFGGSRFITASHPDQAA